MFGPDIVRGSTDLTVFTLLHFLSPTMSLLPTAALEQTSNLIQHLTTTAVHPYLPFARFPVLHAVRVAVIWSALTRGRGKGRGYLQDLFGYLVMACMSTLPSRLESVLSCRWWRPSG